MVSMKRVVLFSLIMFSNIMFGAAEAPNKAEADLIYQEALQIAKKAASYNEPDDYIAIMREEFTQKYGLKSGKIFNKALEEIFNAPQAAAPAAARPVAADIPSTVTQWNMKRNSEAKAAGLLHTANKCSDNCDANKTEGGGPDFYAISGSSNIVLPVPDNCYACYEKLVINALNNGLPYLFITPDFKWVEAPKAGEMSILNFIGGLDELKDKKKIAMVHRIQEMNINTTRLAKLKQNITLDYLIFWGEHGTYGYLFGQDKKYWREKVAVLAQKKLKARIILIDACFTADFIDIFEDLLVDNGVIIANLTAGLWTTATKVIVDSIKQNTLSMAQVKEKLEPVIRTTMAEPIFLRSYYQAFINANLNKPSGALFLEALGLQDKQKDSVLKILKNLKLLTEKKGITKSLMEEIDTKFNDLSFLDPKIIAELTKNFSNGDYNEWKFLHALFDALKVDAKNMLPSQYCVYWKSNNTIFYDKKFDSAFFKDSAQLPNARLNRYYEFTQMRNHLTKAGQKLVARENFYKLP